MIHTGDCIEVMAGMPAESVDAVVTDPPYGLEFMGKAWDQFKTGRAAKYKSGGEFVHTDFKNLGSLPTYVSRPALRCITCGKQKWSGSPCKCEKPEWREDNSPLHAFQAWCEAWGREALRVTKPGGYLLAFGGTRTHHRLVCGLEDAGWIIRDELTWVYASGFPKGKANLKPAHEPIVLARKPGPLRPLGIDAGRIPTDGEVLSVPQSDPAMHEASSFHLSIDRDRLQQAQRESIERTNTLGRWPSNVLLSDPALFDEPNPEVVGSGATDVGGGYGVRGASDHEWGGMSSRNRPTYGDTVGYGDSGGYSRFFLIPKAGRSDREPVLRGQLDVQSGGRMQDEMLTGSGNPRNIERENAHPTVKPVDLMRHLIRLVTPTGGTILDPFLGSGTTGIAAEMEGFPWIGIEKEPEYVAIAEARLNGTQRGLGLDVPAPTRQRTASKDLGPGTRCSYFPEPCPGHGGDGRTWDTVHKMPKQEPAA